MLFVNLWAMLAPFDRDCKAHSRQSFSPSLRDLVTSLISTASAYLAKEWILHGGPFVRAASAALKPAMRKSTSLPSSNELQKVSANGPCTERKRMTSCPHRSRHGCWASLRAMEEIVAAALAAEL